MIDFLNLNAFGVALPVIVNVNGIEALWFHQKNQLKLLESVGCWGKFLRGLLNNFGIKSGETCKGVRWQFLYEDSKFRPSRCIEIIINDERLILTLCLDKVNLDETFVIKCSDEKILPLAILFGDEILA